MMIKTMQPEEKDTFLQQLYRYVQHFKNNPDSLISKIYGVFTIEQGTQKDHILIMRDISNSTKDYKVRVFDLKGSTVDRSVLAKNPDAEKQKKTLKDNDF